MKPSHDVTERRLFEQLVRDTRDDLLTYALRRAGTPEDAADVLSETYLIAWHKLEKVPPGDNARLWLFGVAANVLRRGAQRHRSSDALIERLRAEPPHTVQIEAVAHEDGTIRALRAGLARLPARDREILTLTAWEGLTPKQIAAATGLPANVVRVRLHRARSRLRRRITQGRPPTPDAEIAIVTGRGGT
ncbi:MAG TPA: sigma-70 family RNA polymerase sigma factor [Solirubrobacteraceae bacterium]